MLCGRHERCFHETFYANLWSIEWQKTLKPQGVPRWRSFGGRVKWDIWVRLSKHNEVKNSMKFKCLIWFHCIFSVFLIYRVRDSFNHCIAILNKSLRKENVIFPKKNCWNCARNLLTMDNLDMSCISTTIEQADSNLFLHLARICLVISGRYRFLSVPLNGFKMDFRLSSPEIAR